MNSPDYIIIGAGSAGCVLANRLSENPNCRVLVIEAGPADHSLFIHMPLAFSFPLANDRYNWYFMGEPEPWMDQRRMYCPRGRVLGGSSSINGMVYIRGHALDYDGWAKQGLTQWSYAHCLPYFKKSETRASGGDEYRGDAGPMGVSTGACKNPLYPAFMTAAQQAGYAYTADMNGYRQEGIGPMDMTVQAGRRSSTMRAYLKAAMQRPNVDVITKALVTRILFKGNRATGIEYRRNGHLKQVRCGVEVLLCGGAINSPQLLQLSGIGDGAELQKLDIKTVLDLPGVGQNLQDHLEVYVQQACTQPISLYSALNPIRRLGIGIEWILNRTGVAASNGFEAGGFIRSRAGVKHPDLQYHFLPIAMNYDGKAPAEGHGYQAHVGPMRPLSRGSVSVRNNDPGAHPSIIFNYMAEEQDRQEMRDAIRLTREILAQNAFDEFRGAELAPGPAVQTDNDIDAFIRSHGESAYHPCGTCAMGNGNDSVVDSECRVHGVDGLRVVDASIMPTIVSGNLNAPTIMMAEKAADIIKGIAQLPPSTAPFYVADNWESAQR